MQPLCALCVLHVCMHPAARLCSYGSWPVLHVFIVVLDDLTSFKVKSQNTESQMRSYTCDTAHLKRVSAAFAELAAECWVGERLTHEQLTEVRVQHVAT
jgi:hypothetical protein